MNRSFVSSYRYKLLGTVVLIAFMAVLSRLSYLHIFNREHLNDIVEANRKKFDIIHACRGDVVDARGNVLATTRSVIELGVDPQMLLEEDEAKWPVLAKLIKMPYKELAALLRQKTWGTTAGDADAMRLIRWRKLVDMMDEDLYEKVAALKIKGVYGNRKFDRIYPGGDLAAHVLGYVNKEEQAVMGVEHYMDLYLRGQDGWRESERDGKRREMAQFRVREVEKHDGYHVALTIDSVVQHLIEEELELIAADLKPQSASIIVSEPTTGYILGMANYPSYDPNKFWEYDLDTHRNRSVSDVYEPGSTFKIVASSAALEEGITKLSDEVDCGISKVEYNGRIVRLPKDYKQFGVLSIEDVVRKSSNRGMAHLGMLLGENRLYKYAKAYGFGEKLGYGPGGEVSGMVADVKRWDGLTISRFPMGHAIGATALQVNYAMSVIANRGVLMKPKVVMRVFDDAGNTIVNYEPEVKRRVLSVGTAKVMAKLLSEVVGPNGTSRRADVKGFGVAGKSGTSQKIINGKYSTSHHIGSFSGFFPYDNPRVVMTIVIDDAKVSGTAYGGVVAAPRFKNVAEKLIQYLNVQPIDERQKKLFAWRGDDHGRN
ncbi:MAG: peptidoglycan glycosyltransferase [Verrucomicrobia bacterium CG_4_10_14_3_um_filter_43_23]|nr:MAG: peptidoglycan glycosyltransferase [Verrucomicrobia bacterium CG1_02_43_26]PIP60049.1 MAG: peptidoglycan glycosyltransferase [Verrucomicrobia bacterium CG22_combo_CG10-13_8_21_14_all_43_17]PIX58776.1 MAG: peptidoglycan glycosyltransferase [Verrucomicrobia bacterium CG_4_10_14_3_um_filter_43_23]PIY62653.1 MAG: peptidoglycan glycosyltransferase [Verrucomicrobia bacterium CG_4_10_14_0_8_um_filter_43_34]